MAVTSFVNPLLEDTGADVPSLATPVMPTAATGLSGLGPSMADFAMTAEKFMQPEPLRPAPTPAAAAYFSPSKREIFRKGLIFTEDDAARALEAEQLPQRDIAPPAGGDWIPLDEAGYSQYVQSITQPSMGRLASKSFGRGVDVMQALAGRGLQLAGAEELGGRIVAAQEEDLRKTAPYERMFTDIESGRDAVEWFVANFAQQGPNLIESVLTAGLGFLAGTAAGGPLAGASGALAGLMGKTAFKESVKAAARKKAAGEALTVAENKLLREAAGIAGAVTASYTQNLATGAADIYGELRDSGADANDIDARLKALAGSVPYAALETLPEYLLASRVLGGVGAPTPIPAGTTLGRRGAELLRRGGIGFGVGGLAEGTTEAGQEALLLGTAGKPLTGDEGVNRLINSFAAGFGVGGPIGAIGNLRGNTPANLLDPGKTTEPPAPTTTAIVPAPLPQLPSPSGPGAGFTMVPGTNIVPQPSGEYIPAGAGLAPPLLLPAPNRVLQVQSRPGFVVDSQGNVRPATADDIVVGVTADIPPVFSGQQGVLNIFGGEPVTAGEITARMQPPVAPTAPVPPIATAPPEVSSAQMGLPFEPLSPFAQQIADVAAERQRQNFLLAQEQRRRQRYQVGRQQLEAQDAAQREADFARALAQQQLQMIPPAPTTELPTPRQAYPTEPQQLPLFGARGLPRPSGAERLRRGATPLPEAAPVVPVTPRESLRVARQLPLFTQEGQPSVAALKGAGLRRKVRPEPQVGGRQRPSEPAEKIRVVAEKIRKRQRVDTETPDGGRFVGIIDNEGNLVSGKYTYPDGSEFEGSFRDNGPYTGDYTDAEKAEYKLDKGKMTLTKEAPGAVQKREAEKVPARKPAGTGKEVGARAPSGEGAAAKGEALKKGGLREEPPVRRAPPKEVKEKPPAPKAKAAAAAYANPSEAWEDMKPDEAPAFTDLSAVQQAQWTSLYETNDVSQANAAEIMKSRTRVVLGERGRIDQLIKNIREARGKVAPEAKDKEEIDTLIEKIETTKSRTTYKLAVTALVDWLYFADSNAKKVGLDVKVYEFLDSLPTDDTFRAALIDFARVFKASSTRDVEEGTKATGRIKATTKDGEHTPVFKLVLKAGMLDPIRQKFGFDNLPESMRLPDDGEPTDLPEANALKDETDTDIGDEWDNEDGAFFRDDGQPIRKPVDIGRVRMLVSKFVSKLRVKPRVFVFRNQADLKAKDPELYAQAVAARPQGDFDTASAVGYSFGGTPPAAPIGVSRRQFLQGIGAAVVAAKANLGGMNKKELWDQFFVAFDKLGSAINSAPESLSDTKVYELLKADPLASRIQRGYDTDDPAVWERFSLAYEDFENTGDTDFFPDITEEEVIKSRRVIESAIESIQKITQKEAPKAEAKPVPPTVIIFSDRVRTEQQLNFVLAHESVGHIGFRALVPQNKFDALMNQIYDLSPAIRNGVNAAMEVRGMPKSEAVEEYLADFAAQLDVSLVARIWNVIKGALNKLGIKFGDEAARYFVDQSRRYVRNGDQSAFFTVQGMISRLQAVENGFDPSNTGRFAEPTTLRDVNILAGGLMGDNAMPQSVEDAVAYLKKQGIDFGGSFDSFKSKVFDLLVFRSRENAGLDKLERIMNEGRDISMSIKVAMKERMAILFNRAITDRAAGMNFIGGTTQEQIDTVNRFLYDGMRYAISEFKPESLGKEALFKFLDDGSVEANQKEIDRLYALGNLKFEDMRDGFSYQIEYEKEGKTVKETVKVEGVPGLTEESVEWKGYLAARETMKDVELRLLQARYLAFTKDRDLSYKELTQYLSDEGKTEKGKMSKPVEDFLNKMYRKYYELWTEGRKLDEDGNIQMDKESIKTADDFLVALNTAIIANEPSATDKVAAERNAKVAEFFTKLSPETVDKEIEEFKKVFRRTEESQFAVQSQLKNLIASEIGNRDADAFTKQTLATGYVPLLRRGGFEVRVQAFDDKGNPVVVKQEYRQLLAYRQFEEESEALDIADQINKVFGDSKYKVEVLNRETGKYELKPVSLKAVPSVALDAVAAPPQLNLNEFTRGLRQFSITLRPAKLQEIIVALTKQNNRARQRLMRRDVPGADPDAVRAVSEHVESRASTIAKIQMRPAISELMNLNIADSRKLWQGDKAELDRLEAEWKRLEADPTAGDAEYAKRTYDRYAFMYKMTNPPGRASQGNKYFNEGSALLQFMENNRDLEESDFGAGEVASNIRAATSIMQLGGSIATGALNYIGVITNAIPFLATYNKESSFGGGFGFGASYREFFLALNQVGLIKSIGNTKLNTAEYYDEIAKSPQLQQQFGLTDHEAKFIASEIREGTMIPAQLNALTETARGRLKSAPLRRIIEGFMWTFNATEQASRRSVGLAAYRLEYARRKAAGFSDTDASDFARRFAVETLRLSLGDYSVLNRPSVWRSGVQSFFYMYKVFPTTTIMLLSRLPRKGQVYMLMSMLLLAGMSGLPFAEDLEDIIDTIAQKLGFKSGSIRFELAKTIDAIAPGMSTVLISGASSYILPGDVGGRVSLGNFIPGTGMLLAGANVGREAAEIGGPALGMITGTLQAGLTSVKAATSESVTLEDWLRENPVTALRLFGDSLAYAQSGAVVDRRGYVVSQDSNTAAIITRLLGFYPAAAANEYSIIRISKRITDYQKEVTAGFRQGWIKAKIEDNPGRAREIENAVREWNKAAEGTGLEINNFVENSNKALREARRPAKERLLRAAPTAAREDLTYVAELLGY